MTHHENSASGRAFPLSRAIAPPAADGLVLGAAAVRIFVHADHDEAAM